MTVLASLGDVRTLSSSPERTGPVIVILSGLVVLGSAIVAGFSLREWSSLLGVVALVALLWRALSTLPEMSHLARALSTVLGLELAAGAIAQWLLAREVAGLGDVVAPSNTWGISLVVASRLVILAVVIAWPSLLNRWDWPRRSEGSSF